MPRVGWGVISIRSSEQVQVAVLVVLLTISHFTRRSDRHRSWWTRWSGSWSARDPETGCGCCTNLTLECPVLSVSPFTGSVLTGDLCFTLILSLKIFVLNSTLAGNVVLEINFARIVINSCCL